MCNLLLHSLLNPQKLSNMFSGYLIKKNSKMGYSNNRDKLLYDLFIDKIKEGEEVEIFVCRKGLNATPAQITKVHACIREISYDIGFSFEDMKLIVKEKAGLCYEVEDEGKKKVICKSFADCSLTEISLAIEACNQIAANNNIILG
jgi:hypothetical protein